MAVSIDDIRMLRERTGSGVLECKKALEEVEGDLEMAARLLRQRAGAVAEQKATRATEEGAIASYVHFNGRVAALVELACETDFVARNEKFTELAQELSMHVAGSSPRYISADGVPEEVLEQEQRMYRDQAVEEGKPENIASRIAQGRLEKFYQAHCLLEQPYRDQDTTIGELIKQNISVIGENIRVRRFVRFALGEDPTLAEATASGDQEDGG